MKGRNICYSLLSITGGEKLKNEQCPDEQCTLFFVKRHLKKEL
jgi:predicted RNA-binding Zn ribbon-like protein